MSHAHNLHEKKLHGNTVEYKTTKESERAYRRRTRIYPEGGAGMVLPSTENTSSKSNNEEGRRSSRRRSSKKNKGLKVDTSNTADAHVLPGTPDTAASTPGNNTPAGRRGSRDARSPGIAKTPDGAKIASANDPLPDFITQTDRDGNAATPRSKDAIENARAGHASGPKPALHVDGQGNLTEDPAKDSDDDASDSILDSFRMMCCCLGVDETIPADTVTKGATTTTKEQQQDTVSEGSQENKIERIRLLPAHHPDDVGKKCLVLDLDETLVHSSFRAVPGADFVIPVQIEDVVHFVYVVKRPGVDEFLTEMAKHYEIVIYTASLNKYADPLLDLLDPNRVIRTRLFRESCVYYEGNYVKDLSLIDRDLSQSIIIDNSPSSYAFHPENAIDCSSFIDDPKDRELDQIGAFLKGIKDVNDVRGTAPLWKKWPNVDVANR